MQIQVLCISKRPRHWVTQASDDYLKRLRGQLSLTVREVTPLNQAGREHLKKEADRLTRLCPERAHTVALDERGDEWSTLELADQLATWRERYSDVVCFIGGADGLLPELVAGAHQRWALSRLTLPHQLARVLVIEQLYRAFSVLQKHPYHRA